MKFNFRQDVLVLPASVLSCCEKADAATMRVLLWLASDLSLIDKPRQLAKLADCSEKALKKAIELWTSENILAKESGDAVAVMAEPDVIVEKKEKRVLQRADTLPVYSSSELADLIERQMSLHIGKFVKTRKQTLAFPLANGYLVAVS